jgi:hypothetical protein
MMAIWLGGHPEHPYPPEYVSMKMCQFYHCLPSQLAQEDAHTILLHMEMLNIEERAKPKPVRRL